MNINVARASGTLVILWAVISGCTSTGGSPSDPLHGTSWDLIALEGNPAQSGAPMTATFEDGTIYGSSGCNSYGGEYVVAGDAIEIRELQSTLMACETPDGIMEQEQQFVALLDSADSYRIDESELRLMRSGRILLTFVRDG